jgi:hypothetical protein
MLTTPKPVALSGTDIAAARPDVDVTPWRPVRDPVDGE